MMPLSAHLSGSPASPSSTPSTASSRPTSSSSARHVLYTPAHFRFDHSPREARKNNRSALNILLTVGIFLQIYQIYRTTPIATGIPPGSKPAGFHAFTQGFSSRAELETGEEKQPEKDRQVLKPYSALYDIRRMVESQHPHNNDPNRINPQQAQYQDYNNQNVVFNYNGGDHAHGYVDFGLDEFGNWTEETEAPFQYSKYNYSLPAVRTKYTLPTEPKPTNEAIAVIILSARSNFERRQAIRESWAQNHSNVYFIVGGPEPDNLEDTNSSNPNSTTAKLLQEHKTFGDILDTIHPDTYKSLPYKLHYAVKWIGKHPGMQQVQWIVKADDDAVVRINTIKHWVLRKFNPSIPIVVGRMEANSRPRRAGKWAEDPLFEGDEYPPWAYGSSGYVMSRPVADYLASQTSFYYYQGEDTSLGIWLYESNLDVTWVDSPQFTLDNWRWSILPYAGVIGHDLTPEAIRECFEKYGDPEPLAEFKHADHIKQKGRIFWTDVKLLPSEIDMGFYSDDRLVFEHYQQNEQEWEVGTTYLPNVEQVGWNDESGNQKVVSERSAR